MENPIRMADLGGTIIFGNPLLCRGSLYILPNPNHVFFIWAPDHSILTIEDLRIKFVHRSPTPKKKGGWKFTNPPGNDHISHLWKIKIIDSKWTFQGDMLVLGNLMILGIYSLFLFFPKKEKRFGRSDVMFASPAVSVPAFHPSRA